MSGESTSAVPELSLVIPMFNEADGLDELFATVLPILNSAASSYEIIAVNDGSSDGTLERLLKRQESVPQLRIVDLSRNFGKESALPAGLAHCRGACAISIDADLQDPPELIPEMLAKWREGWETVVAVHVERDADPLPRRVFTLGFYWLLNAMSKTHFVPHASEFRLLDRRAIDAFLQLSERTRYSKGLFAWIGFRQYFVEHRRPPRTTGKSSYNLRSLVHLATDGITSFSLFPLRLAIYMGFAVTTLAFGYGSYLVLRRLIYGTDVPGYTSTIVAVMFFGGVNLFSIGILGSYIGRIFLETKQRPLYVIRRTYESRNAE